MTIKKTKLDSDGMSSLEHVEDKNYLPEEVHVDAFRSDIWFYRIVIITLAIVTVGSLAVCITICLLGRPVPEFLLMTFSTSIGGLIGVFAPTRRG